MQRRTAIHLLSRIITTVAASIALGSATAAAAAPAGVYDGYLDQDALTKRIKALDSEHAACAVEVIGKSADGIDLVALTLSDNQQQAGKRPAILVTAGLDGRHLVGTETAVRVAEQLLNEHGDLLSEITVYVLPRMNPDGTAMNLGSVNRGYIGTKRAIDEDRDGAVNEDAPVDMNGDGVITQMRRPNPPLDDPATLVADPVEPRLLKTADAAKGEHPMYSVYIEGRDHDGDGRIAEDGIGYVDLDNNFMHLWPEYELDSGPYQLSEPEAMALAQFVLNHPNIVAAVTYGRHDNLVNVPTGKGRDDAGAPLNIDEGDVDLYKEIARRFEEATGQKRAPKEPIEGSFHAWLYAQRGVPSFATVVWGQPDKPKKDDKEEGGEVEESKKDDDAESADEARKNGDEAEAPTGPFGSWTGTATFSDMPDAPPVDVTITLEEGEARAVEGVVTSTLGTFDVSGEWTGESLMLTGLMNEAMVTFVTFTLSIDGDSMTGSASDELGMNAAIEAKRDIAKDEEAEDDKSGGKKDDKDKPADEEAAAWLKYSDAQREGSGFVEWQPFEHPTLGDVEIGGFVPGFQMNPPAAELDELAAMQTAFIVDLISVRPQQVFKGPDVKRLGPGLYEIRFAIVNDGLLPTATKMAERARANKPTIVRLSTPVEHITAGERVSRTWSIGGSGGRFDHHWIIRAADDSDVSIEIVDPQLGERTITFTLGARNQNQTSDGGENQP